MKLMQNKFLRPFILLTLTNFLIEIIFKLLLGMPVLSWSTFRIFVGLTFINIFISIILSWLSYGKSGLIIKIICVFTSVYALVELSLYNYMGSFYALSGMGQAGAVQGFVLEFIQRIEPINWVLFVPVALLFVYFYTIDKQIITDAENQKINFIDKVNGKEALDEFVTLEKKKVHKRLRAGCLIALVIGIGMTILYRFTLTASFMQNSYQLVSTYSLFKNPSLPTIAISEFGIEGFGLIDIKSTILPNSGDEVYAENNNKIVPVENDDKDKYQRVFDDTKWIELQDKEKDSDFRKLNNYFMNKSITPKNEYTGLFEGKNLIVIMLESVGNVAFAHPDYLPNINKLYNEGWAWTNNYSPRNSCSTGNNEMTGMTSLYSINGTCTANVYKDNKYYNAIFNLFNNQGYKTTSYHDYDDHYYYRHVIHPNMGSTKFYDTDDLDVKRLGAGAKPWPSDVEFVEKSLPHFIDEEHFMVWMTTVSTHLSYIESSVTGDMYLSMFDNEDWDISTKRYMSKMVILDKAIGKLLEELEAKGILDNTVIAMYGDHYPYALEDKAYAEIADYDITGSNVDRTPFIIYNPSLTPKKFDSYTNYINVLPTLANLFNLDYDPRLYGGYDLLSEDYPNYIVWADGSWRTEIGYYDASKGNITYYGDKEYTLEEVNSINTKISTEMSMDNLAIKKNYFAYLDKNLNKKED